MSESPLIALVVGGTGVVGRYIIKHLASPASRFQLCYSCSRRPTDVGDSSLSPKLRSIQVDLLKLQNSDGAEDGRVNLGRLGITHLFFAGYAGSVEVAPNLAMLENALSALDGPTLRHVHLESSKERNGTATACFQAHSRTPLKSQTLAASSTCSTTTSSTCLNPAWRVRTASGRGVHRVLTLSSGFPSAPL